jgi:hypothetical protein
MKYQVSNYFGGVHEFFDDYDEAKTLFDSLVLDGSSMVEITEYETLPSGGTAGHGIEYYYNGKHYFA